MVLPGTLKPILPMLFRAKVRPRESPIEVAFDAGLSERLPSILLLGLAGAGAGDGAASFLICVFGGASVEYGAGVLSLPVLGRDVRARGRRLRRHVGRGRRRRVVVLEDGRGRRRRGHCFLCLRCVLASLPDGGLAVAGRIELLRVVELVDAVVPLRGGVERRTHLLARATSSVRDLGIRARTAEEEDETGHEHAERGGQRPLSARCASGGGEGARRAGERAAPAGAPSLRSTRASRRRLRGASTRAWPCSPSPGGRCFSAQREQIRLLMRRGIARHLRHLEGLAAGAAVVVDHLVLPRRRRSSAETTPVLRCVRRRENVRQRRLDDVFHLAVGHPLLHHRDERVAKVRTDRRRRRWTWRRADQHVDPSGGALKV